MFCRKPDSFLVIDKRQLGVENNKRRKPDESWRRALELNLNEALEIPKIQHTEKCPGKPNRSKPYLQVSPINQ